MQEATAVIATALKVEYAKVLELLPDGRALQLRAGVGWKEGLVGHATVGTGRESQAGYTLQSDAPVIVQDLRSETRFSAPPLLRDHGVVSGMSVVIQGQGGPYGVLGAHTVKRRTFTGDDIHFLQAVAHILASAINREQMEARSHTILRTAQDGFWAVDRQGRILDANEAACELSGYSREELLTMTVPQIEAKESPEEVQAHIQRGIAAGQDRFETRHRRKNGAIIDVEVSTRYVDLQGGRFFSFMRDISARKRTEQEHDRLHKEVESARQQPAVLSRLLMEVQEAERRHLAKEMHDEVGQKLTAIRLNLLSALQENQRVGRQSLMHDSLQIVDGLVQQVRSLSLDLRPPMLDDYGLAPTLQWYLEEQAKRAGIAVESAIDPNLPRLRMAIEVACFRVAQEAVTNVIRHAKAHHVWVSLYRHDETFSLGVMDDGRGFDVQGALARATEGKSLGLLSMQERIQFLGGEITIDSLPGTGTRIHAMFPIHDPAPSTAPVQESAP
jgi:PAS domain S-box-containing protein